MDPHTVTSDVCLAVDIYGPKQRNDDPQCGMDTHWMYSRQNPLVAVGSEVVGRGLPFKRFPIPPFAFEGKLELP